MQEKHIFDEDSHGSSQSSLIATHGTTWKDTDEFEKEEPIPEFFKPDFARYTQGHSGMSLFGLNITMTSSTIKDYSKTPEQLKTYTGEYPYAPPMPFVPMLMTYPVPT